ncbi:formin-like isoform X3 [Tachysurus ichikawai]
MEGNNSSGSLLHKLLASPRFAKRESQQQSGENTVLKSFRTLPKEETYPHPTNHSDINTSCVRVGSPNEEVPQSSPFLDWRRPFSSSFADLDSDVVQVTRVETYIDNENEEEKVIDNENEEEKVIDNENEEEKVTEKSSSLEQKWDLHYHGRESYFSKTHSILSELTRGDDRSLLNRTCSIESSDRKQESSPYTVDDFRPKISPEGLLADSYQNNGDGQRVSPYRTEDFLHVSPSKIESSPHFSALKLSTESEAIPAADGNVLDSRLHSEKQISHEEESCGTATPIMSFTSSESLSSIAVTSPSSTVQPGGDMTKDALWTDQKVSLNDSVPDATSPSQVITEDMPATKNTTSVPSTSPTHKSLSTTSAKEPFQMPALFSGVRVLKKGAVGDDRETVSEIKQKDTDRALLSLKQHVNKAKLKQHQTSTSTHKKGTDPKAGAESKNQWRRLLNFDETRNEESIENEPKGNEDLNTGEKLQAQDTSGESFKFLSGFKPLFKDSVGDTSVDVEAVKKKRKNERELLKSIFEKQPSKSLSIDKSPGETELSSPGESEDRTPGRLQAIWPPPKPNDEVEKVGLRYTEAGRWCFKEQASIYVQKYTLLFLFALATNIPQFCI